MYEPDLALNNLQRLICHKTQPNPKCQNGFIKNNGISFLHLIHFLNTVDLEYTYFIPYTHPKKWGCSVYDSKLRLMVMFQFWRS